MTGGTLGLAVQAATVALRRRVRWPDTSRGSERPGRWRGSQRQHDRQPIATARQVAQVLPP